MTAWLRRNRWGLLALPLTLALTVAANSQRIHDYWWDQDLRRAAVTGDQGQWATWSGTFTDATGESTRTFQVKVAGAEPTDRADDSGEPTPLGLPAEVTGREITLDFRAAPDQVLYGCRLALVDDEGNRYVYRAIVNTVSQAMFPCLPDDHPGPRPSITAGEPRTVWPGDERPPQWSTRPVVVVPREARITQVLLWWEEPNYLAVHLN